MKVAQVALQILEGLSLGEVVGELFEIADPEGHVLPVHKSQRVHGLMIGAAGHLGKAQSIQRAMAAPRALRVA
jgi:hypothetical protein